MWNSYDGSLERVKTLLEMGLVSIRDKDAVSSLAVPHAFHSLAMSAHFYLTRQDGRTMLDYAVIGAKNENVRKYGKHDETIAFLQSGLYLSELTALVLTRSCQAQTSPCLPPLLPQTLLAPQLLRLPQSTLVLLCSRSKSLA
jgi:hypothetical protein